MDSSFTARERAQIDTGAGGKAAARPASLQAESEGAGRREASAPDHGFSLEVEGGAEGYRPVASQPSWHLWGMMVGLVAAGAAILTVLSLTAA